MFFNATFLHTLLGPSWLIKKQTNKQTDCLFTSLIIRHASVNSSTTGADWLWLENWPCSFSRSTLPKSASLCGYVSWRLDTCVNTENYTSHCHAGGPVTLITWDFLQHKPFQVSMRRRWDLVWLEKLWGKKKISYTIYQHSLNASRPIKTHIGAQMISFMVITES